MDRAGSPPTSDREGAAPAVTGLARTRHDVRVGPDRFLLRVGGVCLAAGGVLWQPLLAAEHLGHLEGRSGRWGWYADQVGFLLVMVLVLVGLPALDRGESRG